MNEMRKVELISTVNKIVGVKLPEYNINRKWTVKGQKHIIPFETLEQMLWHEGFRKMIDRGILYIESMKDKIDLGLEDEGATEPENIKVLSDIQIKNLLVSQPFEVFKREIQSLNDTQINNVINYAIVNEVADIQKASYLTDLTSIDVLKAISTKREMDKIDERNKNKRVG